jgi:hypothetical protein
MAALSLASAYDSCQQAAYDGSRLSWQMAENYTRGDTTAFNALVDQWNAWVRANFGEDQSLLVQKLVGPVDLSKPYLLANNTTQDSVVHSIDGSNKAGGPKYTTNDMNLLPDPGNISQIKNEGGAWLGGV